MEIAPPGMDPADSWILMNLFSTQKRTPLALLLMGCLSLLGGALGIAFAQSPLPDAATLKNLNACADHYEAWIVNGGKEPATESGLKSTTLQGANGNITILSNGMNSNRMVISGGNTYSFESTAGASYVSGESNRVISFKEVRAALAWAKSTSKSNMPDQLGRFAEKKAEDLGINYANVEAFNAFNEKVSLAIQAIANDPTFCPNDQKPLSWRGFAKLLAARLKP